MVKLVRNKPKAVQNDSRMLMFILKKKYKQHANVLQFVNIINVINESL